MLGCVALIAVGIGWDYSRGLPVDAAATFVGRQACVDCHREETESFQGSHHDLAMDHARSETVLGDFDDATLEHDGMVSRMFRDGERFMVHTEGPDGEMHDYEVAYVFGVYPLQQYMVEFDRPADATPDEVGRLQVLRISWDCDKNEWFYLRPPDVDDKLEPDDPLHWTGMAQRWQTMCADCHSTNLKRNFDVANNEYRTTFSEIDVSCESCHGPASLHVQLASRNSLFWDRHHGYGLAKLKGDDPQPQLDACAACHSRRGVLDEAFLAGEPFCNNFHLELLRDDTYHADGQIKDEVYVYGSFIQSKMYHKGIRCTDCHDPHSLKLKAEGNQVCTSCHQHAAGKYDVPSHHHHPVGSAGAQCVNCHMPHTTYMEVDARRDHSLRVPRPDLSVSIGTPNACSSCHVEDHLKDLPQASQEKLMDAEYADWLLAAEEDNNIATAIKESDRWCDEACEKWYGDERKKPTHFAEALVALRAGDTNGVADALTLSLRQDGITPAIARATALDELAMRGERRVVSAAKEILERPREDPLLRATAARVIAVAEPNRSITLLEPLLKDTSRLVRSQAAQAIVRSGGYQSLSGSRKDAVDAILEGVKEEWMVASDRAGSHMGWAMLCEQRGQFGEAIQSYQTAIRLEPTTTGPRTNLAALLERLVEQQQQSGQAREVVAKLDAEGGVARP